MELRVDGNTVFAATGGRDFDPALPCILFIHGAGMDHTVWQLQTRWFAWHGWSVLALDLPGHGRSGGAPLLTVPDMADWIGRVLDVAGVDRAALVGHSLGAFVALAAGARLPDRVTHLALLGVSARMEVHPALLGAARHGDHLAYDLVTAWGFGRRAQIGGHRSPGMWMTGGGIRLLEREHDGALASDLAACDDWKGAGAAAADIACPVLFLLARADVMTPARLAAPLSGAIAEARTVLLDCGHMMMIERPDETLDALREAIAGVAS